MKTQREVRAAFWQGMPAIWAKHKGKRQNDCPADIRQEFCDFVDHLQKTGIITEALAGRVTL